MYIYQIIVTIARRKQYVSFLTYDAPTKLPAMPGRSCPRCPDAAARGALTKLSATKLPLIIKLPGIMKLTAIMKLPAIP
jgi:hypothetical protein